MDLPLTRRALIASAALAASGAPRATPPSGPDDPSELRRRIALSDLHYTLPVARSEEGMPIGNGRMGSLVWTTPSQVRLQINRVDVYPAGSRSNSFNGAHEDYCGGCAFLDLRFGGSPFRGGAFAQHLSVFDGVVTIAADGLRIEIVADRLRDVFAMRITDRRGPGTPPAAFLRALRFAPGYDPRGGTSGDTSTIRTKSHVATTRLHADGAIIALSQDFREDAFASGSAVAVAFDVDGAGEVASECEVALVATPAGSLCLFVGSAAKRGDGPDPVGMARRDVAIARSEGFEAIARRARAWWRIFWEQGSMELASADGAAQALQRDYHYFLYLMACASAGALPPKFNGMLWNTGGDARAWGAQHWYTNMSCLYEAIPQSGRFALLDPFYDMYSAMLPACRAAARDQWGSEGIFVPETVYFDGPAKLPPEIAAEMRALYLSTKSWSDKSPAFVDFASTKHPYASAWNWKTPGKWVAGRYVAGERGAGPYGPTSHIFAVGAKIAYLFWQRYEFTLDRQWLRERAYPLLRGAVEFYRNHPALRRGPDGRLHLHDANNSEPVRGAHDTNEDLSALRGIVPVLLKASAELDLDRAMRPQWQHLLDTIAPLARSDDADVLGGDHLKGPPTFAAARGPARYHNPAFLRPDPHSLPTWFFDLCDGTTADHDLRALAEATFDALLAEHGPGSPSWNNGLTKLPIAAALLGRADQVRALLPRQMGARVAPGTTANAALLRNRLSLGEGPQALSAEHLGRGSHALQLALLQSAPPVPAGNPLIQIAPAWPNGWDARFTLHARGGFVVDAIIRGGMVRSVAVESLCGSLCRMRNPFAGAATVERDSRAAERVQGPIFSFPTSRGERLRLLPDAV
ncbi:glycosyl hydrolase family 95 catalytic domain-containing protein [Sphingomonas sp. MMS24-J13]|uniref:glycosyl hydrolase family 95 catalytic domain-containing protein n=1 Tax=Sphingomonas sp. MMS24-J13 TaxID=3238686 RepID=UPI00384C3D62